MPIVVRLLFLEADLLPLIKPSAGIRHPRFIDSRNTGFSVEVPHIALIAEANVGHRAGASGRVKIVRPRQNSPSAFLGEKEDNYIIRWVEAVVDGSGARSEVGFPARSELVLLQGALHGQKLLLHFLQDVVRNRKKNRASLGKRLGWERNALSPRRLHTGLLLKAA